MGSLSVFIPGGNPSITACLTAKIHSCHLVGLSLVEVHDDDHQSQEGDDLLVRNSLLVRDS